MMAAPSDNLLDRLVARNPDLEGQVLFLTPR